MPLKILRRVMKIATNTALVLLKVPKKGLFILKRNAVISGASGAFLKHSGLAFVDHE